MRHKLLCALGPLLVLSGCAIVPRYASVNEEAIAVPAYGSVDYEQIEAVIRELDRESRSVRRASFRAWHEAYQKSHVFVGIAISGGGSRAANFSAAVLEELDRHGFLKHATALSSAS